MQRGDAWAPVAERLSERYPSVLLDRATDSPPRGSIPVGYSMGGRVALHAALEDPGRWPALVLVGVSAGVDAPGARRRADEELAAWMEAHPIEDVVERWETSPVFATQSPEVRDSQRPGRMSHDPRELAALLRARGQGAMPAVWARLGELELPVLCLAGEKDPIYVAAARRMSRLLPSGAVREIPGCGHAPQIEAPPVVAGEIEDFLRSVESCAQLFS
jgi:2-succinyl-6-hydroxy-2,4-cyclohexadiene-1-carboxylate synthase